MKLDADAKCAAVSSFIKIELHKRFIMKNQSPDENELM